MNCHICNSSAITYYRQIRKDGVSVVTARCENGHIPEKGHPFYSVAKFNVFELPLLGAEDDEQMPLFELPKQTAPTTGMFIKSAPTYERLMGEK